MRAGSEISEREALELLVPGGALQGPVFGSLLARLMRGPAELDAGARVGPYRVVDTLGSGGMAVVYLAERADGEFEQRVALKLVIPADGAEADAARELLRRERQILASLEHPRIARLLDGGTTDEGALWFAMEVVEGERIDRWCDAARADRRRRLELFLQVCEAVQFAHARLLVHRDLKPSNILVTKAGEVKLLDFGIAAINQPGDAGSTPRALTPGYASPEQRRGEIETTASDVWQLGRLLDALVFGGATVRDDADLRAIIACARNDDPAARYATVGDFAGDVRRVLERRAVLARNGNALYRARRFVVRHRAASALAGVALAMIVALASAFTVRLAQERDTAAREAERANATVRFLVGLFRGNEPATSRGEPPDAKMLLDRGVERLDRELADQPEVRARLLLAVAQIHDSLGDATRARTLLDEAIALTREGDLDRETLTEAALTRARIVLHQGRPLDVLALLAEIEPTLDAGTLAGRRNRVNLLGMRAMAQMGSGDLPAALATEREAIELARATDGPGSAEFAARNHDLGIVFRSQRDFRSAAAAFDEARRIYRTMYGESHPLHASAQKNLASALLELGELDRAEPLLLEAVERYRVLYDGEGALYGAALRSRAQLSNLRGDRRSALADLDESARLIEAALGPVSTALAYTLQSRADTHAKLDDPESALRDFTRAWEIRRALLPPNTPDVAASANGMAAQLWRLGDGARAESATRAALQVWVGREADPRALRARVLLGHALEAQGDARGAAAAFDEARRLATDDVARGELEKLIGSPEDVLGRRMPRAPVAGTR
ncbi:MAG TPA: serine/threonine-protein kinase [Candidatus Saccharimonadia bacterium]|nr:serine/threonine-protein kinase [Candidatus Saccharimonadia bacterium]